MFREVKFLPRVGKHYDHSRWGKRVMVLGESHYCANPSEATANITQRVFEYLFDSSCDHEGWMNTYTKFASALSGQQENRFSSEAVWDEVLFYNFIQEPMTAPRQAPTKEQRVAAQGAFLEVIEHYRPDLVLVWGHNRLYDYLPDAGHQGADCCGVETWIYPLSDGHEVRVLPVQHPASAFSPSEWHRTISAALEN